MDQLANLPAPALITFGAVLAVILAVRYFGLWQGQKTSPASSPASAQVAAVIVDPTALNRATMAVEAHTAATHRLIEVEERRTRATEQWRSNLTAYVRNFVFTGKLGDRTGKFPSCPSHAALPTDERLFYLTETALADAGAAWTVREYDPVALTSATVPPDLNRAVGGPTGLRIVEVTACPSQGFTY